MPKLEQTFVFIVRLQCGLDSNAKQKRNVLLMWIIYIIIIIIIISIISIIVYVYIFSIIV